MFISSYIALSNISVVSTPAPAIRGNTSGHEASTDELMSVIAYNEAPVTLSGGDPLAQPEATLELVKRIKSELGYNIWCYTGYTWEQITNDPMLAAIMPHIDTLVDSRFILEKRDTSLRFKGSSNQRIIDVQASLKKNEVVLLDF